MGREGGGEMGREGGGEMGREGDRRDGRRKGEIFREGRIILTITIIVSKVHVHRDMEVHACRYICIAMVTKKWDCG